MKKRKSILHSDDGLAVSEEEYFEKYYEYVRVMGYHYEWNTGYLEEIPASDSASFSMYTWFNYKLLREYHSTWPIANIVGLKTGFRLALSDKVTIRRPDLAVISNENSLRLDPWNQYYPGIFDICIEVLSDIHARAIERDTVIKKAEYEEIGVKEYYLLDSRGKETAFYRLNENGIYENIQPENGEIIKSDILPAFQFRISDLYRQPSVDEMMDDEVYYRFVLPFLPYEPKEEQEQE
ncbi:MAG: Uma2 family endonuclease [Desulfobacteraceae bacterium]|nr:Uma2 family endonuclease [Desulfobacteraceae bacterium]